MFHKQTQAQLASSNTQRCQIFILDAVITWLEQSNQVLCNVKIYLCSMCVSRVLLLYSYEHKQFEDINKAEWPRSLLHVLTCVYFPILSSWLPSMSWTAVPAGGGQHFAAVFIKITHYQSACYHRSLHAAPCSVIKIPDPAPNTTPQHTHTQDTSDWNITAHTVLIQTSPVTNTPFPNSKSEQSFHSVNKFNFREVKAEHDGD